MALSGPFRLRDLLRDKTGYFETTAEAGEYVICTSTTRPASSFEGQRIYETDTKRAWTRVGSIWVPDDLVFANEAARDAAILSPRAGMRVFLTSATNHTASGATYSGPNTGITTVYNGTNWVCVTPISATNNAFGQWAGGSYVTSISGGGLNPAVTLVTGTSVLVSIGAYMWHSSNLGFAGTAVSISGATTVAASDDMGSGVESATGGCGAYSTRTWIITGLTAGVNTFTQNYRASGGTGNAGRRNITVQGIA